MNNLFSVKILQCMRFRHLCNSDSVQRKVMDYEFDFCIGCDREMKLDGVNYKITPGALIIRKPGQTACSKGLHDCYMLTLDFSNRPISANYSRNTAKDIQPPFESEIWDVLPSVFKPSHKQDYLRIFEEILAINEVDINENPSTLPLVSELLHLIIADAISCSYEKRNENQSPMNQICAYLKEHFRENIRLDDIAGIMHLNKNHLVRLFKKSFGISPIAYLIKIRMNYAKKLLLETDMQIKTIAAECGYTEPTFFNNYFKKTFSLTPVAFRRAFTTVENQS